MTLSDPKSIENQLDQQFGAMKFPGIFSQELTSSSTQQQLLQPNYGVGQYSNQLSALIGRNLVIQVDSLQGTNLSVSTAISLPSQKCDGVMNTMRNAEPQTIKLKGIFFFNELDFQNVQLLLQQAAMVNAVQNQTIAYQTEMNSFQNLPSIVPPPAKLIPEENYSTNESNTTTPQESPNQDSVDSEMSEESKQAQASQEEQQEAVESDGAKSSKSQQKSGEEKSKKQKKKKRKYVKSGLYRKDKSGRFIFSSANRARLSALMQTFTNDPKLKAERQQALQMEVGDLCPADAARLAAEFPAAAEALGIEIKPAVITPTVEEPTILDKECIDAAEPDFYKGFDIFFREQRALLQQQSKDGELSFEKTKKILVEQWKALPILERQKYKTVEDKEKKMKLTIVNNATSSAVSTPNPTGTPAVAATTVTQSNMIEDSNEQQAPACEEPATDYSMLNMNTNMQRVKRPLNAYNIFCKLHFEEVKKKYPGHSLNKLSQIMGMKWKRMSDKEKKIYYDKVETTPRFKKPLNSYNLYTKTHFEAFKKLYPNKSINEVSQLVAASWKQLSYEEKKQYYDAAELQKSQSYMYNANLGNLSELTAASAVASPMMMGTIAQQSLLPAQALTIPADEQQTTQLSVGNSIHELQLLQQQQQQLLQQQQQMLLAAAASAQVAAVSGALAAPQQEKKVAGKKHTRDGQIVQNNQEERDDYLLYLNLQPLSQNAQQGAAIVKEESDFTNTDNEDSDFYAFDGFSQNAGSSDEPALKKQCFGFGNQNDGAEAMENSFF